MKKHLLLSALAGMLSIQCAHSSYIKPTNVVKETVKKVPLIQMEQIVGIWIQPNPINKEETQGFHLKYNGEAKSWRMKTLIYKSWTLEDNQLTLVSESVGNKTRSVDTMTYNIKVKNDSLTLTDPKTQRKDIYTRLWL